MEEKNFIRTIRPNSFDEYIGQDKCKKNIEVFVKASLMRGEVLDHTLLYGPPGLGKTTLANIIANELGSNIKIVNGPSIEKVGDLASVLSTLSENDVLFIDEIHRIPKFVEEVLYSAMEDYVLNIIVNNDGQGRNLNIKLPRFTLIGATTRIGDLSSPLRDRFGIVCKLDYYNIKELSSIINRSSDVLNLKITLEASRAIAKRSRKTPRIANRLLKRVSDYALVNNKDVIDLDIVLSSLDKLGIDKDGLDMFDIDYLKTLFYKFNCGPAGVESIASALNEEVNNIIDYIEPYLLQEGFLKRTSRGRMLTDKGKEYIKKVKAI